ncbi:glycosyltransferase family 4 protein [Actinacidiphila bryophytorum]|uniref:D-inositol 3-phosphate glycosyltransferase n=1 Tax=Actinacidiphila bryophytorum TaxID=1436133 RepID=A0A9W4H8C5_9ACTN|nr:glycosyltransferase family 4 protein [Actinacidiphila bryophytorum]MBM9440771.1 glycosyltransferase family 4 protein [Actinacidiphila bryophytorum]MBN6544009.1 glycosyltransferase family 4 protein [Actinacidiphila bryophytorum]CAG7657462.1 Glycosyltransferase involved in cell wall bisynthesis [Actinacidiphila bryophytorum]
MSSTADPFAGQLHAVHVLGTTAGAHVSSLVGGLVARGVEVTVCGPVAAEADYAFGATGARYVPVDLGRRRATAADAPVVGALRAAFNGAGVVHAHGLWAGFLAAVALGGRGVPLVVTWHGGAPAAGGRGLVLRWLERRAVRGATVVLGVSSELVDRARGLGGKDVRLAPAAVPRPPGRPPRPPDEGERHRQKTRADHGAVDRPLLLAVGRLEPAQGYDLLLDAAERWSALDPAPLVAVAGEGGQRAALERRIEAGRLPVLLLGRRDDIPDLLAAADLVVLPSRWEARALIAQEALHAGVPLVATDVGGMRELVGDAAVLVPYGDPGALAAAVTSLLADPDRRAALSIAGRAQAATWPTEDDTVAQILSIYDELTQP